MLIIGHRGACGHALENTLASIKKALDIGVDAIEFDIHKTADDQLVLMHDDTIDRTTNGSGSIAELSLSELEKYDAGNHEKIPTLQEALDLINKQAIADIEIKDPACVPFLYSIINSYVNSGWQPNNFIISSFDLIPLKKIHSLLPTIQLMAIISNATENWLDIMEQIPISLIAVSYVSLYKDFVTQAHEHRLKVIPYTVNDPSDIKRMIDINVDGIISDYPDRIKEYLAT